MFFSLFCLACCQFADFSPVEIDHQKRFKTTSSKMKKNGPKHSLHFDKLIVGEYQTNSGYICKLLTKW